MADPEKALPPQFVGESDIPYDGADMTAAATGSVVRGPDHWYDEATDQLYDGTTGELIPHQAQQPDFGTGSVQYRLADPSTGRKGMLFVEHDDNAAIGTFGRHFSMAITNSLREMEGLPPLDSGYQPAIGAGSQVYEPEGDDEANPADGTTAASKADTASAQAEEASKPDMKKRPPTTAGRARQDDRRRRSTAERTRRSSVPRKPATTKPVAAAAADAPVPELSRSRRAAVNTAIGAVILAVPMEGTFWLMTKDHKNLIGYLFELTKYGVGHVAGL